MVDVVRRTAAQELEARRRRHRHVPFDMIADRVGAPRDSVASPLCQLAFNYRVRAMADVALREDCQLARDSFSDV